MGNTNHLSYNTPGHTEEDIKFFNGLKAAIYTTEETYPSLIPFIDGDWNEQFTDNIHLCHRVSDQKGNTAYKLMRLDLAGPVIKLEIDGQSIRASSPAIDLDDSTWKYLASSQRTISHTCNLLKDIPQPTGRSATVAQAENGHYYCFIVTDKRGHVGRAWIKADLDEASPPQQTETTTDPPATTNTDENQQNQQLTEPSPEPSQNSSPEPINSQAGGVDEASPATTATNAEAGAAPAETTIPESEAPAEDQNTEQPESTPTVSEPTTSNEPVASSGSAWPIILALIGALVVGVGGWLIFKTKGKTKE